MSAGMLSNPSALFLCMSYWADAMGQTARGSGFATIVPPEFHCVWKLKALQIGSELWGTLECFISEEFGTITWQALELWLLPVGEAWMVLNCVERTELRSFGFAQATRIQPCYQAAKESMTAWSSAKCLKENIKTTVMEVKTARHLLCWWIAYYKVCFSYASGNKTFTKRGIGRLLKEWRSTCGKKCLKCESHPAGNFYMGVLRPELSLLFSLYMFYNSLTWITGV